MRRFAWSALYQTLLGGGQALRVCAIPVIFLSGMCFLVMGFTLAVSWSLLQFFGGWQEYIQPGMPLRHYRPAPFRIGPLAFRPWHVVLLALLAVLAFAPEWYGGLGAWIDGHRRWVAVWCTVMAVGLAFGAAHETLFAHEQALFDLRDRFELFFRDRMAT